MAAITALFTLTSPILRGKPRRLASLRRAHRDTGAQVYSGSLTHTLNQGDVSEANAAKMINTFANRFTKAEIWKREVAK